MSVRTSHHQQWEFHVHGVDSSEAISPLISQWFSQCPWYLRNLFPGKLNMFHPSSKGKSFSDIIICQVRHFQLQEVVIHEFNTKNNHTSSLATFCKFQFLSYSCWGLQVLHHVTSESLEKNRGFMNSTSPQDQCLPVKSIPDAWSSLTQTSKIATRHGLLLKNARWKQDTFWELQCGNRRRLLQIPESWVKNRGHGMPWPTWQLFHGNGNFGHLIR